MSKYVQLASAALGLAALGGVTYVVLPGGTAPVSQTGTAVATTAPSHNTDGVPSSPSGESVVDETALQKVLPANLGRILYVASISFFGKEQNPDREPFHCDLRMNEQPVCRGGVLLKHDGMKGALDIALVPFARDYNRFQIFVRADRITRHEDREGPPLASGRRIKANVLVKQMWLGSPYFRDVWANTPSATTSFDDLRLNPVTIPFNYKAKDGSYKPAGTVMIGLYPESYQQVGVTVADVFAK